MSPYLLSKQGGDQARVAQGGRPEPIGQEALASRGRYGWAASQLFPSGFALFPVFQNCEKQL